MHQLSTLSDRTSIKRRAFNYKAVLALSEVPPGSPSPEAIPQFIFLYGSDSDSLSMSEKETKVSEKEFSSFVN